MVMGPERVRTIIENPHELKAERGQRSSRRVEDLGEAQTRGGNDQDVSARDTRRHAAGLASPKWSRSRPEQSRGAWLDSVAVADGIRTADETKCGISNVSAKLKELNDG